MNPDQATFAYIGSQWLEGMLTSMSDSEGSTPFEDWVSEALATRYRVVARCKEPGTGQEHRLWSIVSDRRSSTGSLGKQNAGGVY
jgi:hypothetical protein